jgi:hypothetical protein
LADVASSPQKVGSTKVTELANGQINSTTTFTVELDSTGTCFAKAEVYLINDGVGELASQKLELI